MSKYLPQVDDSDSCGHVYAKWYDMYKVLSLAVCRGPGAGAEVTAGGVFSDLLRLAAYLGAPS